MGFVIVVATLVTLVTTAGGWETEVMLIAGAVLTACTLGNREKLACFNDTFFLS